MCISLAVNGIIPKIKKMMGDGCGKKKDVADVTRQLKTLQDKAKAGLSALQEAAEEADE